LTYHLQISQHQGLLMTDNAPSTLRVATAGRDGNDTSAHVTSSTLWERGVANTTGATDGEHQIFDPSTTGLADMTTAQNEPPAWGQTLALMARLQEAESVFI